MFAGRAASHGAAWSPSPLTELVLLSARTVSALVNWLLGLLYDDGCLSLDPKGPYEFLGRLLVAFGDVYKTLKSQDCVSEKRKLPPQLSMEVSRSAKS